MACFNQKSLDLLVNSILKACRLALDDSDISNTLKRNAKRYATRHSGYILTSTIAASIGVHWLDQMKTDKELKKRITLLCYYQLPYPKANVFNIVSSGLLLICDKVTAALKKKELSDVLALGLTDKTFAYTLALNLQQMLPLQELKSNVMCLRPKFYKDIETHQIGSLEYQYQQITDVYSPWISKPFLALGLYPTLNPNEQPAPPRPGDDDLWEQMQWDSKYENGTPNEQAIKAANTLFNYSVEGGMNEEEALAILDAIWVAEDILKISENWFNFNGKQTCVDKSIISASTQKREDIRILFSQMYDLETLDTKHTEEAKGRADTFFQDVFGKSIIEDIHKEYTKGDPVQFRLFSPVDGTDESSRNASEYTLGQSNVRECHLLPLSRGTVYNDTQHIEPDSKRRRRTTQTVTKSRDQRNQDNFFAQMASGDSYLKRMVVRIRPEPMLHEITQDSTYGREVYVNNRFDVALTVIHELMHTYFAMVDFYYRDMSTSADFKGANKTGPVSYSGLSLGTKNEADLKSHETLQNRVPISSYPRGKSFDVSKYNWQINNVDNYMVLFTKLYLMDEELVKQRFNQGDADAYKDRETLAKFRLSFMAHMRSKVSTTPKWDNMDIMFGRDKEFEKSRKNMTYLDDLERKCWVREKKQFNTILTNTLTTSDFIQRFD